VSPKRLAPVVLLLGLAMAGCPKRPASLGISAPAPVIPAPVAAAPAPVPAATPFPAGPVGPNPTPPPPREFGESSNLADIHFDFDRYAIRPGDAKTLDANAVWLKTNHDLLLIEGHCDERGTTEYNLALGERRARAAMSRLVADGVAASRITIISYGKERPLCTAHDESCWARNRRAHFLIKAG